VTRPLPILALALATLAVAGCGQSGSESSAEKFKGEQKAVAEVVEDLQEAGEKKDAERICSTILSPTLVAQVKAGGASCAAEMKRSLNDADQFELDVQSVTVEGTKAEARVKGEGSETATMSFAKERGGWRATDLGG
jgi:hypothetical protein